MRTASSPFGAICCFGCWGKNSVFQRVKKVHKIQDKLENLFYILGELAFYAFAIDHHSIEEKNLFDLKQKKSKDIYQKISEKESFFDKKFALPFDGQMEDSWG